MIEIYTDGAGSNQKTLCGGWAFVVFKDGKQVFNKCGCATNTTNNRMELKALLEAMRYAAGFEPVTFYVDSAYITNCFKDKWYVKWEQNNWMTSKKSPVLNKDLWESILQLYKFNNFTVLKVKAHDKCQGNIIADRLAVEQKKKQEGLLICNQL